jgi:hypothetical protein
VVSQRRSRLKTASRATAWLLLALVLVAGISGWAITRSGAIFALSFGHIDRGAGNAIHRALVLPLALAFLSHVLINARLALHPSPMRVKLVNAGLAVLGSVLLAVVILLEFVAR